MQMTHNAPRGKSIFTLAVVCLSKENCRVLHMVRGFYQWCVTTLDGNNNIEKIDLGTDNSLDDDWLHVVTWQERSWSCNGLWQHEQQWPAELSVFTLRRDLNWWLVGGWIRFLYSVYHQHKCLHNSSINTNTRLMQANEALPYWSNHRISIICSPFNFIQT